MYQSQSKILLLTIAAQRKRIQRQSHPQTFTRTLTIYFFSLSLSSHLQIHSHWQAKTSDRGSFELAAQLAEFWLGGVGELGVETLECLPYAHHLAGRKLEPVPQQAGEEVQQLGSRWREPVNAVPHL